MTRLPPNRLIVQWPGAFGGWVVQSATSLRPTGAVWTVVETVPASDGVSVRQTNIASGAARWYRLWQP